MGTKKSPCPRRLSTCDARWVTPSCGEHELERPQPRIKVRRRPDVGLPREAIRGLGIYLGGHELVERCQDEKAQPADARGRDGLGALDRAGAARAEHPSRRHGEERRDVIAAGDAPVELGTPTTVRKRLEGVRSHDEVQMRTVHSLLARQERTAEDRVQEGVLGTVEAGETCDLADGGGGADAIELATDTCVGVDERRLGDHVERTPHGKEEVDLGEEVGSRGETATGLPGPLGDGTHLRPVGGEKREDEVLLAELGSVEDHCARPV